MGGHGNQGRCTRVVDVEIALGIYLEGFDGS